MDLTWLFVLVAVFVAVVILPYVYNLLLGENAKFDPKGKVSAIFRHIFFFLFANFPLWLPYSIVM